MTIPNPNPMEFSALILGVLTFIFIMLLPALIEIKKPKDAGPRIIENSSVTPQAKEKQLFNMEDEHYFDQKLTWKVAEVLSFLYNLES